MFVHFFQKVNNELYKTGKFELMNQKTDEDEHSIEMQLSYVAKVMERFQKYTYYYLS